MQKSYEYFTRTGIKRTDWFEWNSSYQPKWQLEGKLRNYYRA